jgi:hypothetical protein
MKQIIVVNTRHIIFIPIFIFLAVGCSVSPSATIPATKIIATITEKNSFYTPQIISTFQSKTLTSTPYRTPIPISQTPTETLTHTVTLAPSTPTFIPTIAPDKSDQYILNLLSNNGG